MIKMKHIDNDVNNIDYEKDDEENIEYENQYLFKYLCIISVLTTAQGGAVPSMLENIKEGFTLSFIQQGLLGGAVYIGLSLACPMTGILFRKYDIKKY